MSAVPVIQVSAHTEVRVYACLVTWFSWITGTTGLWPQTAVSDIGRLSGLVPGGGAVPP